MRQYPDTRWRRGSWQSCCAGMTRGETAALTQAMLHSEKSSISASCLQKKWTKHSNWRRRRQDLARLARWWLPAPVRPMITAGLGPHRRHARQTRIHSWISRRPDRARIHRVLKACGCCMIGQTKRSLPRPQAVRAARRYRHRRESYLICARS